VHTLKSWCSTGFVFGTVIALKPLGGEFMKTDKDQIAKWLDAVRVLLDPKDLLKSSKMDE
jgi:hypothetical protein